MIIYRFILRSLGGPVNSSLRTSSRVPALFLNVSDVPETSGIFLIGVHIIETDTGSCGGGGRGGGGGGGSVSGEVGGFSFCVTILFSATHNLSHTDTTNEFLN